MFVKGNDSGHNVKHYHGLEENHEIYSENARFPARDFNTGSPELEARV
jgi:hypothetical protein